jgi:hypothetical protein
MQLTKHFATLKTEAKGVTMSPAFPHRVTLLLAGTV